MNAVRHNNHMIPIMASDRDEQHNHEHMVPQFHMSQKYIFPATDFELRPAVVRYRKMLYLITTNIVLGNGR